jgi:hypothetical protein
MLCCGGYIGAMSVSDYTNLKRRAVIRSTLIDYVRRLADLGSTYSQEYFLWEIMPSPREIPHTPEEAIELMEEVNEGAIIPIYLCFDLGHCNSFDFPKPGDPHTWLEKLLPWVRIVHLQQTDGLADRHWPFTPEYNKKGIINPERIVDAVKCSPFFEVPMFLELGHPFDASDIQIVDDHKSSIDYWINYI